MSSNKFSRSEMIGICIRCEDWTCNTIGWHWFTNFNAVRRFIQSCNDYSRAVSVDEDNEELEISGDETVDEKQAEVVQDVRNQYENIENDWESMLWSVDGYISSPIKMSVTWVGRYTDLRNGYEEEAIRVRTSFWEWYGPIPSSLTNNDNDDDDYDKEDDYVAFEADDPIPIPDDLDDAFFEYIKKIDDGVEFA